ncbi:TPA: NAD(P)-dependent alcohol dehydrogenase [Candidatus Poribacteria bacterium]|nr:NAD(P)-dependent alcohol dehydrogenase [Candidatus Poribacteria bacterium]
MKAALLYKPGDIRVEEIEEPKVQNPDEVLVKVEYVGICGSDVHYYAEGEIGDAVLEDPLIIGHEPAGVVLELGPSVKSLKPGDRVAIDPAIHCGRCEPCLEGNPNLCLNIRFFGTPPQQGAFREKLVHPEHLLFKLPPEISTAGGAMLEVYGVAIHAVELGKVKPGYEVAVIGGGPVGLATAQIAALSGASRIFLSEPIPERREMAKKLGADVVIDPTRADTVQLIMDLTNGRGVDVAFEAAGEKETFQQCVDLCKNGGTAVFIGIPSDDRIILTASRARRKGLTIRMARRMKNVYPRAIKLAASGRIDPEEMISHLFPLERIAEAFEMLKGKDKGGAIKVMIEI